jgi:transposase
MKKLTTTKVRRTAKLADRGLTIGIDLGDRSSCYCVLDESGEIVLEQKVSTTAKAIEGVFAAMARSRIALGTC